MHDGSTFSLMRSEGSLVLSALDSLIYELDSFLGDGLGDDDVRRGDIEAAKALSERLKPFVNPTQPTYGDET